MWSALASSVGTLLEYALNPTQSPPLKYGKTFLQKKLFREGTSGGGGGGEGEGRWYKPFWGKSWEFVLHVGTNDCIMQREGEV